MIKSEEIRFSCGKETLTGTIDWSETHTPPSVLSLHGAGPAARNRITYLTSALAENGMPHNMHGLFAADPAKKEFLLDKVRAYI